MVAENPETGVSLGAVSYKMRIARPGRGKSSGARVVFLLTVFAKNEKANLSTGERVVLIEVAKEMIEAYRRCK